MNATLGHNTTCPQHSQDPQSHVTLSHAAIVGRVLSVIHGAAIVGRPLNQSSAKPGNRVCSDRRPPLCCHWPQLDDNGLLLCHTVLCQPLGTRSLLLHNSSGTVAHLIHSISGFTTKNVSCMGTQTARICFHTHRETKTQDEQETQSDVASPSTAPAVLKHSLHAASYDSDGGQVDPNAEYLM